MKKVCWFSRTDVLSMVMLFHGKKEDTTEIYSQQSDHRFSRHISLQENKVAATEQGNFYWERRLCLFWILYKESITMLLVSLVHQFVWPTFSLVFTRNGIFKYSQKPWMRLTLTITSIFTISDRAAFRGTFRIEANQKSKVELYSCK